LTGKKVKIDNIKINNFRSIEKAHISLKNLSLLIGNNGTGKTSILEAIHYALSPNFLSGRIKQTDFYSGTNEPIIIELEFCEPFDVEIPDGYTKQSVSCKNIYLEIKKRERATPGKTFSDGFVVSHYYVPVLSKTNEKGWELPRKSSGFFKFTERQLALNNAEAINGMRSFYFNKNRSIQLKKGYNSSITSLFDDLNWRFIRNLNKNEDGYFSNKETLEKQILSKIDDKVIEISLETLNKKLNDHFSLPGIDISFIEAHAPFNSAFLSKTIDLLQIGMDDLGSGVEMIISLLFLETMASLSKENIVIIIDEPELHLHPSFQRYLIRYLKKISIEKQIIVSTHSPYFFADCCSDDSIKMLVTKKCENKCIINDSDIKLRTFPWSPSWGEINYYAYDLPTIQFHNELYGYLQKESGCKEIKDFDTFLENNSIHKIKKWINEKTLKEDDVTICTYIRHTIHHQENKSNPSFTHDEFTTSITNMLNLIKKLSA
jgi:predicted ATP-dependent endonuclease of OLD family